MIKILKPLRYLLILPFVVLTLWAASWGTADLLSHQALAYERQWISEGIVTDQRDWDAAVKWSELSIKLNPFSANYVEMLGRIYRWRFFVGDNPIRSFEEAEQIANTGLNFFRRSIELRPTWPRSWANLLQLKSIVGQIDYEFERVWEKSVELGDWEPEVQTILLEAGLIHWDNFSPSLRDKTLEIFVSTASKPYSQLRAIAVVNRLQAWPLVCSTLVDPIVTPESMRRICADLARSTNQSQFRSIQ